MNMIAVVHLLSRHTVVGIQIADCLTPSGGCADLVNKRRRWGDLNFQGKTLFWARHEENIKTSMDNIFRVGTICMNYDL